MTYPENDDQFEDKTIDKVEGENGKYWITCDGWSLHCGDDCPVKTEVGQIARHYGRGIGSSVRGLYINGEKVWYRTEGEQKEYSEIQSYGADAQDWLNRWDAGQGVWSIEMGGIGPGYEQCIHVTCAEILRWMLEHKPDAAKWSEEAVWKSDREKIEQYGFKNEAIKELALSGAQWGAALNLAAMFYNKGPREVMRDDRVKDRHIQVQKFFPKAA